MLTAFVLKNLCISVFDCGYGFMISCARFMHHVYCAGFAINIYYNYSMKVVFIWPEVQNIKINGCPKIRSA